MALVLRIQDLLNQNMISWGIQSGICKPLFHIISQIYDMVFIFILREFNLKILSNDGFPLYLKKSIISSKESHSLYITYSSQSNGYKSKHFQDTYLKELLSNLYEWGYCDKIYSTVQGYVLSLVLFILCKSIIKNMVTR